MLSTDPATYQMLCQCQGTSSFMIPHHKDTEKLLEWGYAFTMIYVKLI